MIVITAVQLSCSGVANIATAHRFKHALIAAEQSEPLSNVLGAAVRQLYELRFSETLFLD